LVSVRAWAPALLLCLAAALTPVAGRAAGDRTASVQPPAYRLAPGQRATYAVVYGATGDADFSVLLAQSGQTSQPPSMLAYKLATALTGQMDVTVIESTATSVEEWCVFRAPVVRLVINGQPQTDQASRLASQLVRGFLVELRADGAVVRVRMGADADASSQEFLRTFLAASQIVLPPSPPTGSSGWTAREEDHNGPYTAQYQIERPPAHPERIVLRKRMLGYLPAEPAAEPPGETQMRQVVTPVLDLAARLDPSGAGLVALAGTETQDTSVEGKHVAHSETAVRLARTAIVTLSPAQLAAVRARAETLAANSVSAPMFARRSPQEVETNVERTELGAATEQDLLARLAAVDGAGAAADKGETDALYLKFKALAYLHPEAAAPLGAMLASDNVSSPSFNLLAGALGAVGNAEAQGALASAIRARPNDWPALSALVPELCTLPAPTADAEAAARGLTGSADPNISAMAWLCLGGMARGLAQAAPDRSQAILADLTHGLAASSDESAKALMLQALGNANSALAMPAVSPYATSPSAVLRAAAMDAMRAIPLPEVDPLLRQALASDADPKVRLEAAFALGFREPDAGLYAAEKAALAADQDAQVRTALLNDLAKLVARFPEARAVIQGSADNDASDDVRKAAAGLLQSLGPP
jgi:hypothetical protein